METKTCTKCLQSKQITEFYRDYTIINNGHRAQCKLCMKKASTERLSNVQACIQSKICNVCYVSKSIEHYYKSTRHKDGYFSHCKQCHEIKLQNVGNNQKIKRTPEYMKDYWKRKNNDINYRIKNNIRSDIRTRIKTYTMNKSKKVDNTCKYLDCSIEFFIKWIESQFQDGMSWDNYGTKWELDHVKPCKSFDFNNSDEILLCYKWSNYQPLWCNDNRMKRDTIYSNMIERHKCKAAMFLTMYDSCTVSAAPCG
ncbi:intron encoded hypothetical protein [Dishui Lake large algae virus 1]|nr:intron encoded hypothetical protein [Dishui Lake large algae virus 1]